jgi:hypothetical protein
MFYWLEKLWRVKAYDISEAFGRFHMLRSRTSFAAPMVGAPPDNIRAQRLAEGGVPASGASAATSQMSRRNEIKMGAKKLESDPH